MEAFFISAAVVTVAEIGDKTQLLALMLAARYRKPVLIILGIFCATLANHAIAALVGAEVAAWVGADTMRWYMLASPVLRGLDVAMESDAMADPIRRVLNPIWNSWHFLSLYSEIDQITGQLRFDQQGVLDRYILAKTAALRDEVTEAFEAYDLAGAASAITTFLDALTNWYVRRSR